MVKRVGTSRTKTRALFTKHIREKGKISLTRYFATYNHGDHVGLAAEPGIQTGMYHSRFYGRTGTIVSKRGNCYLVSIQDGGKHKTLIVHPVHLRRQTP